MKNIDDGRSWLIWSEENAAWWAPNEMGYASRMDRAGRYTAARAAEIVFNANVYCEVGKWNEIAIPDPRQQRISNEPDETK
jgi:hypothetical protein